MYGKLYVYNTLGGVIETTLIHSITLDLESNNLFGNDIESLTHHPHPPPPPLGQHSALVQVMACGMFGPKPLLESMLTFVSIAPPGTNFSEIRIEIQNFSFIRCIWNWRLRNSGHFVQEEMTNCPHKVPHE